MIGKCVCVVSNRVQPIVPFLYGEHSGQVLKDESAGDFRTAAEHNTCARPGNRFATGLRRSFGSPLSAQLRPVSVQYGLQEHGFDGCNWTHDLLLNCGKSVGDAVSRHLRPLRQEAGRRFNAIE
jgi:hypothetical protein